MWSISILFLCASVHLSMSAPSTTKQRDGSSSKYTLIQKWAERPKVCRHERDTGEKMAFCPSHRPGDGVDWPCVRFADLCNGLKDCPDGEDENTEMCMFHNLQNHELDGLRRMVFSAFFDATNNMRGEEDDMLMD